MKLLKDIQIVGQTGSGLTQDFHIIINALNKFQVSHKPTHIGPFSLLQRLLRKLQLHKLSFTNFNINIFIEQLHSWWMPQARFNVVIPNQEWFTSYALPLLKANDEVWCKTYEAQKVFENLGCVCRYIGFSSRDKFDLNLSLNKDFRKFLHIGGQSIWKGTRVLIDTWLQHPEWPHLTVVSKTEKLTAIENSIHNITVISEHLSEDDLKSLQNMIGIHIQPSEMEGFGHVICEGLSAGAIVVTTNGAPMNELIDESKGFLIDVIREEAHYQGTRHFVDVAGIELVVQAILATPIDSLELKSRNSRLWYSDNDKAFNRRFENALKDVLSKA